MSREGGFKGNIRVIYILQLLHSLRKHNIYKYFLCITLPFVCLENVSNSLGETSHDVWSASGLGSLVGLLAAGYPTPGSGDKLGSRPRVVLSYSWFRG